MTNALLLKSIPYEEFDYQTLLDAVHGYARPRMERASGTWFKCLLTHAVPNVAVILSFQRVGSQLMKTGIQHS